MYNFKEIKEQPVAGEIPGSPEGDCQEIIRKSGTIHEKQWLDQMVQGFAVLILLLFFFLIYIYISSTVFSGLGIMAGTLVMRMCMEFSMSRKRRFPLDEARTHYHRQLIRYYKTRKYLHFFVTPVLVAAYIYGFVLLLPVFEQELLPEFYRYFVYTSCVVFLGLAVLIGVQLKKELDLLKSLIADDNASQVPDL